MSIQSLLKKRIGYFKDLVPRHPAGYPVPRGMGRGIGLSRPIPPHPSRDGALLLSTKAKIIPDAGVKIDGNPIK